MLAAVMDAGEAPSVAGFRDAERLFSCAVGWVGTQVIGIPAIVWVPVPVTMNSAAKTSPAFTGVWFGPENVYRFQVQVPAADKSVCRSGEVCINVRSPVA